MITFAHTTTSFLLVTTVASASAYIQQEGYSFPIYFDTSMEAAMAYQAYSIPITFFIGEGGVPIAYYTGAMSRDILQQGIDRLLQSSPH